MDSEDASTPPIGDKAVEISITLRSTLAQRISEVVAMTEREVMAAAESVHSIVGVASGQVTALKEVIRNSTDGAGESSMGRAISLQLGSATSFAKDLAMRIEEQRQIARAAADSAAGISEAASSVQGLTRRANILALNARIEATRLAGNAQGFSVIATDMKNLSQAIADLNGTISGLARTVQSLIPKLASGVETMSLKSHDFSETLRAGMSEIEEVSIRQRNEVNQALETSDQAMSRIIRASHQALSHLQFQDAVAQGLMRLDSRARDAVVELCKLSGREDRIAGLAPAMHIEMGGEKPVEQTNAGEVTLF
ncbi:MAG: methyl-accepting chemotaxis protein [Deltaproteobacteria bacterium]|nr:methyl-accepting chemotaxis protein [Deltaproteobacteria bacterium]